MNDIDKIAAHICAKKTTDDWLIGKCPLHDDKNASLAVKQEVDGFVIFKCFAGCESKDLAEHFSSLGMRVGHKQTPIQRREVCRYTYTDADGVVLYEKVRFEPKSFMIMSPHGYGKGGHESVLYRLPDLQDLSNKTIVITEGEKDVETLRSLGFIATTSGGASIWRKNDSALFAGAHVIICPDNDEPGQKYAALIRDALLPIAASIRTVTIPQPYKDVSDWGCTREQFDALLNSYKFKTISFSDLLKLDLKINWLVRDYVEQNGLCQIFGASSSGKSFFALDMAYCVAAGINFMGNKKTRRGNVLYVAGEGFGGLKKRCAALFKKYGSDVGVLEFSKQAAALMTEESCLDVAERIKAQPGGFDLVVIDTLNRNMGPGDENSTKDMTQFISNIDAHFRSLGCAVVIVHHTGLSNQQRARGSGAIYAAIDSEFRIEKELAGSMSITCTKQKEGNDGWTIGARLKPMVIGFDEELCEDICSCVIEPDEFFDNSLTGRPLKAYEALKKAVDEWGLPVSIDNEDDPVIAVTEKQWRDEAYKIMGENGRRDFRTAKKSLLDSGHVSFLDGVYFLPKKVESV